MSETTAPEQQHAQKFIERWKNSGGAERANCQSFLNELCELLGVEKPHPSQADDSANDYAFEKSVVFNHPDGTTSSGFLDLYKRDCFVLEAKQGSERKSTDPDALTTTKKRRKRGTAYRGTASWDDAMLAARNQAEQYAKALPEKHGWPPFLIVVDVGYSIELYADFSRSGKSYSFFPDRQRFRIHLQDLADAEVRELLRTVWSEPMSLDPTRRSAAVTREVAARLARLAKSLEHDYDPETVSHFLMRCLFTMFAEDVGLLPAHCFTRLLREELLSNPAIFEPMVRDLWEKMDKGGFSPVVKVKLLRFNGGLFDDHTVLPLNAEQIELLLEASRADWSDVEPAIFGTLLERALDPRERHRLGAHYTPRAYVERLVLPTVMDPLREEWRDVQTAATTLQLADKEDEALQEIRDFHRRLCAVRVLDPACGSANFLYVTLEHMKRLEGEVLQVLEDFGDRQSNLELAGLTVDPHQFLGIELNPRAATIAEMVLWIGYLQWHFKTRGHVMPPEPVLKDFQNIECRDAVLEFDERHPLLDDAGLPVTRWDGFTMKTHPVTGEEVPDEAARTTVYTYSNPRKASWPQADFIVGNPPFIGSGRMRETLGGGYVEALWAAHKDMPQSADYVMFWWNHAASLLSAGEVERFGLITTNSITQKFSRRVVQRYFDQDPPLSLVFAVPDHPWVDASDGAAVRIAMTTAARGEREGELAMVVEESEGDEAVEVDLAKMVGGINADLTCGADLTQTHALEANNKLASPGVKLHGSGFIVTPEEAAQLGVGRIDGIENHVRPYRNGRDLTKRPRGVWVIDLFGLEPDEVRARFPEVYQWVVERVKPERDQNRRATYRDNWWIFGEPRKKLRPALDGLTRYIATVETSKHRFFTFLEEAILPDNMLIAIALEDAYHLGVLSSTIHVIWALGAGGRLGVGNDPRYNKTRCFDPFPFPDATAAQKTRIRALAEELDAHRKRQQALHPKLTLTDMYNVLEKERDGEDLSAKEKTLHAQGLVSVLSELHDALDAAVFEAYGWPATLTHQQLLTRLVNLNAQRAEEEERGLIRYLRPEFQDPEGSAQAVQVETGLVGVVGTDAIAPAERLAWPKALVEQIQAVRTVLASEPSPLLPEEVARHFMRARRDRVTEILEVMVMHGQVRQTEGGRYGAS
ncbi:class I SAM-dependent DNA methyltransferase [Bradymonadaceae bacterium TMQ3]|nr:class I SAM-dependent DNA methyltransferase [Bradymonadaceae bacterium TMQ3]TXC67862.1 class I SAM-dependent DNA methyltransferase [Bradymonadales bacterium TMQ1]